MKIKNIIEQYFTKYNIPSQKVQSIVSDLITRYSEPHRVYHNMDHINSMLNILLKYEDRINCFESVFYACCFHDVIYDTKIFDNEEKSSEYASRVLKELNMKSEIIEKTVSLIMITKTHDLLENSFDEKIFIDSDLAILGTDRTIYTQYTEAIRKEYSWVSLDDYNLGRKNVLKNFIEKKWIYSTEDFRTRYEIKARENIENEIAEYGTS